VRRGEPDELTCRDDLGALPVGRKVLLVAGDQVVGAGCIGTFEEDIVVQVVTDVEWP
jgi:hypothetical protein